MEAGAGGGRAIEELLEMIHRAGRQIVQHHQAPGLRTAFIERALDPTVGVVPVARDRIPKHAAELVSCKVVDHGRLQQAFIEIAAATEGAEPAVGMSEIVHVGLRAADLILRRIGIALPAERHGMGEGVIADPVAFGLGAAGETSALGIGELSADHEERRLDAAFGQYIEHQRRHAGLGAVVE